MSSLHLLALVLCSIARAASLDPPAMASALSAQQLLLEADAVRTAIPHRRSPRATQGPSATRTRRAGRRGTDRAVCGVPGLVPCDRADRADLAVPAAAARRRGLAALPDPAAAELRQRRLLVDGAGG